MKAFIDSDVLIWHLRGGPQGTYVNNAILATATRNAGGRVYTLNTKHYPVPELMVKRAWK